MGENHIYQALTHQIQEQTRIIMVTAFSGAGAIAGLVSRRDQDLAYATKIAMTALNIEQRYNGIFPPPAVPALANGIIRELQSKQETDIPDTRADVASRIVATAEMQNFAGDVLDNASYVKTNRTHRSGIGHSMIVMANHANDNPAYRQELEHQANGHFEKLSAVEAHNIQNDIKHGNELTPSQSKIISELGAMSPEDVDKVTRMAQTDLIDVVMTGKALVESRHDPLLHEGEMGKTTTALGQAIDQYATKPNGLNAFKLWNKATAQIEQMADVGIDVRVRQSFNLAVGEIETRHDNTKAAPAPARANIARLHIVNAQAQLGR